MSRLLNYFFRGLVLIAPIAVTIYVVWVLFTRIDGWLGLPVPGLGFVLTIALITLAGFLASTFITRGFFGILESVFERLPFVRLVYSSTRDLLDAFVGEKRRFDRPVLVRLSGASEARAVGFVTQPSLERLGLPGQVAVYLPFSYSVAGHVLIFPATSVEPIDAGSAEVMAFVVSGGVTEVPKGG
jgi:uncharacterized membrane protein